ncbi:MAG TPA: hypothetical protein VLX12_09370, partial [Syntrophorhabdales bacterium]|nr:hypothetical protein [Syntrophorhabdales bacterium]
MKKSIKTTLAHLPLSRVSRRENGLAQKYAGAEPPLRSELFSTEQMKQHGRALAASHKVGL